MDEYYGYKAGPTRGQMLARIIVGGVLLFLLIALLIWFLFFRNPDKSETGDKSKPAETSQRPGGSSGNGSTPNDSDNNSSGDSSDSTGDSNGSASSDDNNANGSSSTSDTDSAAGSADTDSNSSDEQDELSNTGPGEVLALFAVAVIAGTALRRYQLAKRS